MVATVQPHIAAAALARVADRFVLDSDVLALDCAAQGPRLRLVLEAGHAALAFGATPWTLSFDEWEARIEGLRTLAADTLFEGDAEGVAMVPSVAFAVATAAQQLPMAPGDAVLVLDAEFPSSLLPWQHRCTQSGARVVAAQRRHGQDWTSALMQAWDQTAQVRVVAVPQVHWHDGALLDLDRIALRARADGIALVLDLSQSLGVMPAELARWRPDFIAAAGHKWLLGPQGLAWLWVAPRWRHLGDGLDQHWQARDAVEWRFPVQAPPPYRLGARRFDAGGVTDPMRLAMSAAALQQLQAWGVAVIAQRLRQLTSALDRALDAHGLDAWKTPGHAPHFTALRAPDAGQLHAATDTLRSANVICTRRAGLLRIAPYLHVDEADMDRVARIVADAVRA